MILCGMQPAEVKFRALPTEADDGYEFFLMKNLNDGFPAVASIVGAVCIEEGICSTRQIRVGGEDDGSNLAFGSEEFSGWNER